MPQPVDLRDLVESRLEDGEKDEGDDGRPMSKEGEGAVALGAPPGFDITAMMASVSDGLNPTALPSPSMRPMSPSQLTTVPPWRDYTCDRGTSRAAPRRLIGMTGAADGFQWRVAAATDARLGLLRDAANEQRRLRRTRARGRYASRAYFARPSSYRSPPWQSLTTMAGKSTTSGPGDGLGSQLGPGDDLIGGDALGEQGAGAAGRGEVDRRLVDHGLLHLSRPQALPIIPFSPCRMSTGA